MPEFVRTGTDILFITNRTKVYQIGNEFLKVSDLIARDVQNRFDKKLAEKQANGQRMLPEWWLEKQPANYREKQRLVGDERKRFFEAEAVHRRYNLAEDYINYTKPSSKMEEYFNRVGIFMFTKYVKRIQRIIMKSGRNSPIKNLLILSLAGYLGGLPTMHEQSFFAKDWYSDSLGPGNVFPVYGPTELFMNFATPSLVKSSTYDFSV